VAIGKIRYNRDLLLIGIPAGVIVLAAFAAALYIMRPAPPGEITISTGVADGTYHAYAMQYREFLARHGVTLRLVPSAGAVENFRRLIDTESDVDVAFVQGGIAAMQNLDSIASLGSLYIEPLWVFHRGTERFTHMQSLQGKAIAVGAHSSGTAALALTLLRSHGIARPPTGIVYVGGRAAAQLLMSGRVDAMFLMSDIQSPLVRELIDAPGIRLMSFENAEAYVRQHFYLQHLTLPEGVLDLERNVPATRIHLLGTTANLLARADLHPALAYLLLRAASEIHGKPGIFAGLRQYPSQNDPEVPLSAEAARYYKSGAPFLQRYLPFWAANLTDRMLVLLLPAVAVLFPVMKLLPPLYRWRVSSRIYRWYAKLKEMELQLEERRTQEELEHILARLDEMEEAVNQIETPLAYSENLYIFRQHIDLVRQRAQARARGHAIVPAPIAS